MFDWLPTWWLLPSLKPRLQHDDRGLRNRGYGSGRHNARWALQQVWRTGLCSVGRDEADAGLTCTSRERGSASPGSLLRMPSVTRPPWPGNLAYRKREQAPCADLLRTKVTCGG